MGRGEKAEISFATGVYYEADVTFLSEQFDYGFAEISADTMDKEDISALQAVSPAKIDASEMIVGEPLYIISGKEYPADAVLESFLVETEHFVENETLNKPQEMLLGQLTGEEELQLQSGMSGSGIYNEYGKLIGILSGGDGDREYMAVPVWNILTGL